MPRSPQDHDLVRRRQHARIGMLKRRIGFASVLGFAAFFGLATQHVVKSSSTATTAAKSSSASATPTSFFDESSDSFSFGSEDTGSLPSAQQSAVPSPPPVAQTSVS